MALRHVLSRHRTRLALLLALPLALAGLWSPAYGDTQPPSGPATVSADPLPTVQIDGVAWTQVIVGNTVYVGGSFTTARPAGAAPGTNTVARSNFLAYDLTTGNLLPFAPAFNSQVRALAVSPDKKILYVGGQFTQVNGSNRYRLVAFDLTKSPATVLTSFTATTDASVYGLAATETRLYAAGLFGKVNSDARTGAAAVDARTGAVQPFRVTPADGTVRQVAVSPDRTKVVLGGTFKTLNGSGSSGYGMAMVNADTGTRLSLPINSIVRNAGSTAAITSLVAGTDGFYGTGQAFGRTEGNLEGAFKADWSGNRIWIEDCRGDTYGAAIDGAVLYIAGHPHDCARVGGFPNTKNPTVYYHALAFTTARTRTLTAATDSNYYNFGGQPAPSLLHWFPRFTVGTYTGQSQATWSVAVGGNYVAYAGEFLNVNGKAQQGLVRFARAAVAPNLDGPRLSAASMGLTGVANSGSIRMSWPRNNDRDNTRLTYKLRRNNVVIYTTTADSNFWTTTALSYTDAAVTPGTTYTYTLTAADPYGNFKTSSSVSIRAR